MSIAYPISKESFSLTYVIPSRSALRTFASETSEFLAPFEVSHKTRNNDKPFTSIPPTAETAEMLDEFSNIQLKSSVSNTELPTSDKGKPFARSTNVRPNTSGISKWNPFEDPTPFNQMTEDHIFEAEFDALRERNGQAGKHHSTHIHEAKNQIKFAFAVTVLKESDVASIPATPTTPVTLSSPSSTTSTIFNSPAPTMAPPPLPPQLSPPSVTTSTPHQSQDDIAEDPFASAPFSLPTALRSRASIKTNRTRKELNFNN